MRTAIAADPRVAGRLALWGRRLVGEAMTQSQNVIAEHGSQAVGFLASARLTNEENYLIQKLARTGVGTNSVHSCEST